MAINSIARHLLFLLSFSFAISTVSATYLLVQGPVSGLLYGGGNITLGKVGPGESFYILASPATQNRSGTIIEQGWSYINATTLPSGWSAQVSPLYEDPMKMKITVSPNTPLGTYVMTIKAVNVGNYSKLGNLTFNAYINVTNDVFSANVTPLDLVAGPGQPVDIKVVINNTGASDDPFLINAYGLPAWNVPFEVIATHSRVNTYLYPVYMNEPGVYRFNITVNSTTSPHLRQTFALKLTTQASVINDFSATGEGVLLSPIIYQPAYSFMLLISDVYHMIFK